MNVSFNKKVFVAPGIDISRLCGQTWPCSHEMFIDGISQGIWSSLVIYEHLIQNGLTTDHRCIAPHKERYEKEGIYNDITNGNLEKSNLIRYKDDVYNRRCFTAATCSSKRSEIVRYLIEEIDMQPSVNALVDIAAISSNDSLELFKYVLSLLTRTTNKSASEIVSERIDFYNYNLHRGNVLTQAAFYNNLPLLKYIIEDLEVKFDMSTVHLPLIEALNNNRDNTIAMVAYLMKTSIRENIKYGGSDARILKNLHPTIYQTLLDNDLIENAHFEISTIGDPALLNQDGSHYIGINKWDIEDLCYTNLVKRPDWQLSISYKNFDIKKINISIKTSIPNVFERVSLAFNSAEVPFRYVPSSDPTSSSYYFESFDPIHLFFTTFTHVCIIFYVNQKIKGSAYIKSISISNVMMYEDDDSKNNKVSPFDPNVADIAIIDERRASVIMHGGVVIDDNLSSSRYPLKKIDERREWLAKYSTKYQSLNK